MKKTQFVMVVHGHQPVGNFDHVIERALERCYEPVLQAVERHEGIRLGLHLSGCLLEWLEDKHPGFVDRLGELVDGGRVELLGGGMYEPVLAAIPEGDAAAQIDMMSAYLEKRFGSRPSGLWLAERIWEPQLAGLISRMGLRYTLVDDDAFFRAGLEPGRLSGYWVTEQVGDALAVFPIDRGLRYAVPFQPVEQVIRILRESAERVDGPALTYGDDLEKFGLWPGTHALVFESGWLDEFFEAVEKAGDWLEMTGPGVLLDRMPPSGRIYLPTAAFDEMQTWVLPDAAIERHEKILQQLESAGLDRLAVGPGPCAPWQNFMVKYSEANHLHKKMLLVSRKLTDALSDDEPWEEEHEQARRSVFRGQCSCAYWHGLFGGLYLPHLRRAIYRELIRAESALDRRSQGEDDWIAYDEVDFDGDLAEEVIVEHALMNVYLDPNRGGVLTELDYRPAAANLIDVMTRRREAPSRRHVGSQAEDRVSPEDGAQKDDDTALAGRVVEDRHARRCFMDRFCAPGTALEELQRATYTEEGDFLESPYEVEQIGIDEEGDFDFEIRLKRMGALSRDGRTFPLLVEKQIRVPADEAAVRVGYRLSNPADEPLDLLFCPELNLSLPGGDPAGQSCEFDGVPGPGPSVHSAGEVEEAAWFALIDPGERLRILLSFDPAANVWRYPVETVSRSDAGLETNYQGLAVVPRWELTIPARSSCQIVIRLTVKPMNADAVVPMPDRDQAEEPPPETR